MKRFLTLAVTTVLAVQHFTVTQTLSAQERTPPACTGRPMTGGFVPTVWLFGKGQCFDLSQYVTPVLPGLTWRMETPLLNIPGAAVRMSAFFDSDPFIDFAFSSVLTDPSAQFAAFFFTPVVPDLYTAASAQGRVSITSGINGFGQVATDPSTSPTFISGAGLVGAAQTNLGVNTGTTPCSATGTVAPATTTCTYGPTFNTFAPTFYDGLLAALAYQQSGLGSVAQWDGTVTLTTSVVPEPSSIVLLAAGLMAVGVFARCRRTQR